MTAEKDFYSKQLDDADIAFLANKYQFEIDFTRGLTDADWANLLGCGESELPFYLFDEETFDEYLASTVDYFVDEDYYFADDSDDIGFDIDYEIERQLNQPKVVSSPLTTVAKATAKPTPKVAVKANPYSAPSRFAKKVTPKVVKHHFEIVY